MVSIEEGNELFMDLLGSDFALNELMKQNVRESKKCKQEGQEIVGLHVEYLTIDGLRRHSRVIPPKVYKAILGYVPDFVINDFKGSSHLNDSYYTNVLCWQ